MSKLQPPYITYTVSVQIFSLAPANDVPDADDRISAQSATERLRTC